MCAHCELYRGLALSGKRMLVGLPLAVGLGRATGGSRAATTGAGAHWSSPASSAIAGSTAAAAK